MAKPNRCFNFQFIRVLSSIWVLSIASFWWQSLLCASVAQLGWFSHPIYRFLFVNVCWLKALFQDNLITISMLLAHKFLCPESPFTLKDKTLSYLIPQSHLNFNMSQIHYLSESGPLGILYLGELHYYPLSYASQKLSNWGLILPVSPWMFRIHVYLHMYLLTPSTSLHPRWHHHFLPGSLTAAQHTLLLLFPL